MRGPSDINALCGVAQALARMGDGWTLLIIRDAFFGLERFGQFQKSLGISKNILTTRLKQLVDDGVLERERLTEPGQRYRYRLTDKGRDLWVVLTAMRLWSDKWVFGEDQAPLVAIDASTGGRLSKLIAVDEQGRPINPKSLTWKLNGATQARQGTPEKRRQQDEQREREPR